MNPSPAASVAAPAAKSSASGARPPRWLALGWLLVMLLLAWHQWQFWQAPRIGTDVFAALPAERQTAFANRALEQLAQSNERRIVVMVGAPGWSQAREAAQAFDAALQRQSAGLRRQDAQQDADAVLAFYAPWRDALLTPEQRESLASADADTLAQRALARLYGLGRLQPTDWLHDPLGLWPAWWSQQSAMTAARPQQGVLRVDDDAAGLAYAVLLYETAESAFRFDGARTWSDALEAAQQQASAHVAASTAGPLRWLHGGIPLFAEEGAAQGHAEMNTIGWGSLVAVLLLTLATFLALRPIALVGLSLAVGCAAGLSATVAVFGQIHVLTIVFGASLVGVAEDFGIHYFAARLRARDQSRWTLMRQLLPGLTVALATSVIAYAVLAIVPFPGLRQMALFSAVGLAAAFATVVCWFPWLDRGRLRPGRLAQAVAASLQRWPRLSGWRLLALLLATALMGAAGWTQLRISDDLRALQPAAPELNAAQLEIGRLLRMPGVAQFLVVQGDSADQVLQREEALHDWLNEQSGAVVEGPAAALPALRLQAISSWVPSQERQLQDRAQVAYIESQVLQAAGAALGEPLQRPAFAVKPLTLETWLASPASQALRAQWLGEQSDGRQASVVLLAPPLGGAPLSAQDLARLLERLEAAQRGGELAGVVWVDRIAELSGLLQQFRVEMSGLLLLGHALVLLALCGRFGRAAWRAWLPCALASVLCVAALGLAGQPFQLFSVLALLLLLGMGVDYGVFLLEHPGSEQGYAWLAVLVGGISTVLSFGLLGLSSTPALRSFGLTLMIGLPLVVVLAPMLRQRVTFAESEAV